MDISNILVVEDDREINNLIAEVLKKENYNVIQAFDGKEAIEKYNENFQIVILDLMLPYVDGIEVLRKIREKSNLPIIILSAKDEEVDRIVGLSMGADDYILKPFSIRELIARIKANLRRYVDYNNTKIKNTILKYRDLKMDILNYKVLKQDKELNLTPKEFELLKLFISNPNRVFTKAQLFNSVWENEYLNDDNTVMVHIKRLRNKIQDNTNDYNYIQTVWGIGYKLGE
ncbi:alkaline phosphatase synthesis transcriptional regulatory protein SphR [Clostridium saccharobutylicum]|uniref:response regulator transcription factor n=1 Tax=Clostridium saccharobutylicum TaxID=169679 RepID=UPI000983CD3C|nr:response regulator transcription factor [Clostridium saccharobutylicum]AQS11831.1 alkaline phosphatase synthesis transcriptional regulatory protein SphR [Clostridium saccharobutylicum]MBC2434818.1 response regulator transcription factor [Clostridium saccharobutylicum]NSB86934.1 DNA-binding response OmpR family regulator [Clostridium saccharobutylicum]NYC30163.1 DNA-binding response OmpR family regulator [Clostridium saccharobutylicum]OOM17570.1 alkaline phosphatase synthesis transcriptional